MEPKSNENLYGNVSCSLHWKGTIEDTSTNFLVYKESYRELHHVFGTDLNRLVRKRTSHIEEKDG